MKEIFLLLGSNRGDRPAILEQAKKIITRQCGSIIQESSLYETKPWGFKDNTPFINQVIEIETEMDPQKLMTQLLTIETNLGRIRNKPFTPTTNSERYPDPHNVRHTESWIPDRECKEPYSPRTIDIDILFYGSMMIFTQDLMIPHPHLHERRFTLEPLNEIAPAFIHPVLKRNIKTLLEYCTDKKKVSIYIGNRQ